MSMRSTRRLDERLETKNRNMQNCAPRRDLLNLLIRR